ncbi:MAG TPA: hypothetical protein VK960_07630 [Acidimicrobiia bacterium]|nr:hypothetical protein [Acidimicrobiia bacterium]
MPVTTGPDYRPSPRHKEAPIRRSAIILAFLTLTAACGDDSSGGILTTTSAPSAPSSTTTTTTVPQGVVSGLDLVAGLRGRVDGTTTTTPPTAGATTSTTSEPGSGDPEDAYSDYVELTDDLGLIVLSVPAEWSDVVTRGWERDGENIGPGINAAPDIAAWQAAWGTPGVFIGASDVLGLTPDEALDAERWDTSCTYEGRDDYFDGLYTGRYDLYYDCGEELSVFIVIAAEPPEGGYLIYVQIVAVAPRDFDAADEIIATFQVTGV